MSLKHLPVELDAKAVKDDGTFEGYASVFNNVDQGRDIVLAGAFKESLKQRPAPKIKMLWQHYSDKPIGTWMAAAEDSTGLMVKGQLALGTTLGKETYELMRMGAVDGMSIGFMTIADDYDSKTGIRKIKQADLREISVVTFPMNEAATVSSVKTEWLEKEVEEILREAGLPREFAKRIVLQGYKRAKEQADPREVDSSKTAEMTSILASITKTRQLIAG